MNPVAILEVDLEGRITYHNQAALRALGKGAEAADLRNFLPGDVKELLATAKQTRKKHFQREVVVNDSVFLESIYFAEQFNALRFYAIDITERKQAEEKLKWTLEDLKRSNRDLEEFAYVSSHDLQEPLRKIANFSEMLAKQYQGQLDEQADRYFGYVTDGAKRMQALINDLLNYSRVGRAEFPLIAVPLDDILKGTLNDLHALFKENHAKISHGPLPTLKVNPYQTGQLLQNLITNAIKFHGDQPPRIHLAARQEGREWVISIRDNGIGFEPQYAEGIFKVFKRLHAKEQYPGTGIGLAICKKIVERHGGRIWAESEPGHGATFYFTIPT
jgi:light-regulated signal transduction histidine kinase (bacteriophytochrome)